MLFPYTYVPHQMDKMQAFIDFIFHEVWCKAPKSGVYNLDLFVSDPELHEVMTAFHYDDSKGAEFFSGHVERIYGLFSGLTEAQISQFQQWYHSNNDMENVCANDPATQLARYADIAVNHKDLAGQLGTFFKDLYSHLDLAALRAKIGDIDDHYDAFMKINDEGKCPFCGISDIFGVYHSRREAYDHYLPKSLYPFNSINFKNLVPACVQCNSNYKSSKDPAYSVKDPAFSAQRRKVFYPYLTYVKIEILVNFAHANFKEYTPTDVSIDFGPSDVGEELATWRNVYGIDERYKAKILAKNDGKYWIVQAFDEWPSKGRDVHEYMADLAEQAIQNPFAECNFLKKPVLDAYQNIRLK